MIQVFSVVFLLLDLSLLILPLHPLGLGFKSTPFSPVFSVGRTSEYNMIIWELIIFQVFFVSCWAIVWADGGNGCGWCLAGGRGC